MFAVNETEAAVIRNAFYEDGELTAGIEFRRLFPGITDPAKARECVRMIAGWQPRLPEPAKVMKFPKARREPSSW